MAAVDLHGAQAADNCLFTRLATRGVRKLPPGACVFASLLCGVLDSFGARACSVFAGRREPDVVGLKNGQRLQDGG